jgi:hypothetical protein
MMDFPAIWKWIEQVSFPCAFFPNENISILGVLIGRGSYVMSWTRCVDVAEWSSSSFMAGHRWVL